MTTNPTTAAPTAFSDAHAAWHAGVEAARTAPYGPLSTTAIHFLTAEPQTLPGLPGEWSATTEGLVTATFTAEDGVEQAGAPVAGTITLGPLTGIRGTALAWGQIQIDIAARSGMIVVRPRDPQSPERIEYTGTKTFAADPAWVITAKFVPAPVASVPVPTALGEEHLQHYDSPGRAEFELDGQPVSLTLFGSAEQGDLRAIFADATGEDQTFAPARFVGAQLVDADTVVIDFNRATNPPAAYTAAGTCPFPPAGNRLAARVEAGELRP